MRYWHGHGHVLSGWGIGVMAIGALLLLALLVLVVIALFRYVSRSPRAVPHGPATPGAAWPGAGGPQGPVAGPTPEQLLAERFARGEIDAEEYRHRLDTLRSVNGPGEG
ncbi:putative membrane protein [Kitasatospora sp. MAA19]|uniref:SHOCT domain-containing protein n=1 Tax=unclassified Kitasatospora TaxID=2633591 RepID=UPI0024739735|nr:SHOCT domain-containing protein [Kitasatospora sp. MAA19]MDH6707418.1 putative membrane protein [Kitasatospora sp. MAA19]